MSPVDFKKSPCPSVKFKGREPYRDPAQGSSRCGEEEEGGGGGEEVGGGGDLDGAISTLDCGLITGLTRACRRPADLAVEVLDLSSGSGPFVSVQGVNKCLTIFVHLVTLFFRLTAVPDIIYFLQ